MCRYLILIVTVWIAGCATHRPAATVTVAEAPAIVREAPPMHEVETRYDLRSYRDADDPSVRHEAHGVYRETLVPDRVTSLVTVPRSTIAPVTYDPLPPSAELSAEIAAQKEITAELRSIQATMAAMEEQARNQYGTLVDQTSDSVKIRQQLEADRARVSELEARLRAGDTSGTPVLPAETNW
jgi:hypothetical protein